MTRVVLRVAALLAALSSSAAADLLGDVRALENGFAKACAGGDVPAVIRLYADDARVIWPGETEETRGRDTLERLVADACRPDRELGITLGDLEVVPLDAARAVALVHWNDTLRGPDGQPFAFRVRASQVLVKTRNGWRILVDHSSIGLPPPPPSAAPREH
jgi:ketosteroid isomerase-like protein